MGLTAEIPVPAKVQPTASLTVLPRETLGHADRALRAYIAYSRGLRYKLVHLNPRESLIYATKGTLAWLKVSREPGRTAPNDLYLAKTCQTSKTVSGRSIMSDRGIVSGRVIVSGRAYRTDDLCRAKTTERMIPRTAKAMETMKATP